MTRISLQEQYDNKDVIQQIKKLKDEVSAADDKASQALDSTGAATTNAAEALSTANTAKETADALKVTVDVHSTAIEQLETQSEQALTDANNAFDTISITQNTEAATLTATRGTGQQEQIPFPIASSVQTGMMNAQTYAGIVNLTARVDKLEASKTVYYVTFSSTSPTDSELTSLFTTVSGRAPTAGDYLTDIAKSLTYGYNGTNWIKVETSADIPFFTAETPGLIKGNTVDGTIAAETDGTGSVNGWDNVKTTLNNHTESIGTIESSLSTLQGTVSTHETEIAGLRADILTKNDKLNAVTVTLTVEGWDSSAQTQTVSASNVTADNIVWVSPTAASFDAYGKAGIRATAQVDGTLTFTCTKVPTEEITVEVVA